MSTNDRNASIVNKTKKLLKEYGYEIKLNHLYNVFSKLSNESSWNVAKAKGTEFNTLFQNQKDLIIKGNSFKKDLVIPGDQINHILDRMTKTLYFSLDNDEDQGLHYPSHLIRTFTQSSKVVKDKTKIIECISQLYSEFDRRRRFSPNSIVHFNPIMVCFNGFYKLFQKSENEELKNKLIDIMKYGQSVGFVVYSSSSRATQSDVPPEIIHKLVNKNIFKAPKKSPYSITETSSNMEINFVGSMGTKAEIGSENEIIVGMLQPEIITRLGNYDPNSFKFNCAELTKDTFDKI